MSSSHHHRGQQGPIFTLPSIPSKEAFQWAPNFRPERRRKLLLSYLPDWLITIALAAIFFSLDHIEGFRRDFSLEDTSLRHPYAVHERIPNVTLCMICALAPLLLQWVVNLFTIRSFWDAHNAALGLVVSLAITGALTQFVKITVGRPRPDFIDRCQPKPGSVDPTFGLSIASLICTQTNEAILRDGFRSFFSGHSSLSFAGLGHFAYYLAGKLHLFDTRGHAGKAWLALSPFAAAALVAISRTMDYRHHWQDVLVGSIVGTVVSFFVYRQYYPPLNSPLSHRPYSPRVPSDTSDRDIEQAGTNMPMTERPPMHSNQSSFSAHGDNGFKSGAYSSKTPLSGQPASLSVRTYDQPHLTSQTGRTTSPPVADSPTEYEDPHVKGTVSRNEPSLPNEWTRGEDGLR